MYTFGRITSYYIIFTLSNIRFLKKVIEDSLCDSGREREREREREHYARARVCVFPSWYHVQTCKIVLMKLFH